MLTTKAPNFQEFLNEKVDTLESSIIFDDNANLQAKILRFLALAEINTGAIKVEKNTALRKTVIRVFNEAVDDLQEILSKDDEVAAKTKVIASNKKVEIEFNS